MSEKNSGTWKILSPAIEIPKNNAVSIFVDYGQLTFKISLYLIRSKYYFQKVLNLNPSSAITFKIVFKLHSVLVLFPESFKVKFQFFDDF